MFNTGIFWLTLLPTSTLLGASILAELVMTGVRVRAWDGWVGGVGGGGCVVCRVGGWCGVADSPADSPVVVGLCGAGSADSPVVVVVVFGSVGVGVVLLVSGGAGCAVVVTVVVIVFLWESFLMVLPLVGC